MSNLNSAAKVGEKDVIAKCCIIPNCQDLGRLDSKTGNRYFQKGFCIRHYTSYYRHGDPLYYEKTKEIKRQRISEKSCQIEGCLNNGKIISGYCEKHYLRIRRNGDPLIVQRVKGEDRDNNLLYRVYHNIKARCHNVNYKGYKYYGARGIKMCDSWFNDFNAFLKDVGERPSANHSIDRIDVNGNYEPNNIRWATKHQQMANKTISNKTVGVSYDKRKSYWVACMNVNCKQVLNKYFKTEQEAIQSRHEAEIKHFGKLISEM